MADDRTIKYSPDEGPDIITALRLIKRKRRKVNKAKQAADEITYLNIVAMMDMMTIILVFLLKSVSFSAVAISGTEALTLPYSSTQEQVMEAVKVFVTKNEIVVEDKKAAEMQNGIVNPKYVSENNKYMLPNLKMLLDREAERQIKLEKLNPKLKFQGNLLILADKDTPYHTIMQVLYTSGQAKGGTPENEVAFGKFRFTVLRTAS